jgi:pimeloyl-ACP methyl ester carboxylesterase
LHKSGSGVGLIRLTVGHWPQLEAPDAVVDQLERMLG